MSAQPKPQYRTQAQPASQRPVRVVAKRDSASMPKPQQPATSRFDFVGIAG